MLPGATLGFLLGVWLFQQQAQLWSLLVWLGWCALLVALRLAQRVPRYPTLWRKLWLLVLVAALGFA